MLIRTVVHWTMTRVAEFLLCFLIIRLWAASHTNSVYNEAYDINEAILVSFVAFQLISLYVISSAILSYCINKLSYKAAIATAMVIYIVHFGLFIAMFGIGIEIEILLVSFLSGLISCLLANVLSRELVARLFSLEGGTAEPRR